MSDKVRIEINTYTREAIKNVGKMGDTYDTLINEMIRVYTMYRVSMLKPHDTED